MLLSPRKIEIIKTAAFLFKQSGYSSISMRAIAEEVGIKAASLYNHIKSKEEILTVIVIDLAERFTDGIKTIDALNDSPIDKIREIISLHVNLTITNSNEMASLENDWIHLNGDNLIYFKKLRKQYESSFREIINKGIQVGEIKNIDPETMLFSTLTTLRSLYKWHSRYKEINIEQLKADMHSVLLDGMRA